MPFAVSFYFAAMQIILRTSIVVVLPVLLMGTASAQINIQERLEQKAKERMERKVDQTIDRGFDKAEEGVDKGAKEATKGKGKKGQGDTPAGNKGQEPAQGSEGGSHSGEGHTGGAASAKPRSLTAYSKFDFVPGEQVVAVEDFTQDAVGDFPARWNTNSSGEVVTIAGTEGRWLKLNGDGIFYPEFLGVIPENCTIEFDVATSDEFSYYCSFITASFVADDNGNLLRPGKHGRVDVSVHPQGAGGSEGHTGIEIHGPDGQPIMNNSKGQVQLVHRGIAPLARVSIWRQKARLRMYLNEEKVWDIPRAFQPGVNYRFILEGGGCGESTVYLKDLRVAAGAPDTRNKLITEGRLVTRGILFDSGSDRIKPESYGTLKEIGTVLTENPGVRVRIIGHTDSDGDEAANLELSKRRAAAVKEALVKEFAVDGSRLETDGKGETAPASPNDSPQGKANNRRVEFVKL
jgi:outer membrane protein OmpA-like peptidoglycan-associated protein